MAWNATPGVISPARLCARGRTGRYSLFRSVQPRAHIVIVRGGWVATMLVSRSPFSAADLATIDRETARMGMQLFLDPRRPPAEPMLAALTKQRSSDELGRWAEAQPLDLRAPTDERPFF